MADNLNAGVERNVIFGWVKDNGLLKSFVMQVTLITVRFMEVYTGGVK